MRPARKTASSCTLPVTGRVNHGEALLLYSLLTGALRLKVYSANVAFHVTYYRA